MSTNCGAKRCPAPLVKGEVHSPLDLLFAPPPPRDLLERGGGGGGTMGQVCFTAISSNRACPTVFIALSSV